MPLYSDSNYYYSGGSSQLFAPYYPSGIYSLPSVSSAYAPYTSTYNRSLSGSYALPSISTPRSPSYTTHGISSRYQPKLSTIGETSTLITSSRHSSLLPLTRIHSPKISSYSNTSTTHLHSKYIPPRPININTADIDVSGQRHRKHQEDESTREKLIAAENATTTTSIAEEPEEKQSEATTTTTETAADAETAENAGRRMRSTIRRNRPVVRLSTMRVRNKDLQKSKVESEELIQANEKSLGWREKMAADLTLLAPSQTRKSPGQILRERHLIQDVKDKEESANLMDEVVVEVDAVNHICHVSLPSGPSFHDICADISSDKIDDDLNAGALRKRASIILEQEQELLNQLQHSASGSFQLIHLERRASHDSITDEIHKSEKKKSKKIKHKITAIVDVQNAPLNPILQMPEEDVLSPYTKISPKMSYNLDDVQEHHETHKVFKLPKKKSTRKSVKKREMPEGFLEAIPKAKRGSKHIKPKPAEIFTFDQQSIEKQQKLDELTTTTTTPTTATTPSVATPKPIKKKLQKVNSEEDFWSHIGTRETIYMANRKNFLQEFLLPKVENLSEASNLSDTFQKHNLDAEIKHVAHKTGVIEEKNLTQVQTMSEASKLVKEKEKIAKKSKSFTDADTGTGSETATATKDNETKRSKSEESVNIKNNPCHQHKIPITKDTSAATKTEMSKIINGNAAKSPEIQQQEEQQQQQQQLQQKEKSVPTATKLYSGNKIECTESNKVMNNMSCVTVKDAKLATTPTPTTSTTTIQPTTPKISTTPTASPTTTTTQQKIPTKQQKIPTTPETPKTPTAIIPPTTSITSTTTTAAKTTTTPITPTTPKILTSPPTTTPKTPTTPKILTTMSTSPTTPKTTTISKPPTSPTTLPTPKSSTPTSPTSKPKTPKTVPTETSPTTIPKLKTPTTPKTPTPIIEAKTSISNSDIKCVTEVQKKSDATVTTKTTHAPDNANKNEIFTMKISDTANKAKTSPINADGFITMAPAKATTGTTATTTISPTNTNTTKQKNASPTIKMNKVKITNTTSTTSTLNTTTTTTTATASDKKDTNLTKFATVYDLAQCLRDVDADLEDYIPSSAENSCDEDSNSDDSTFYCSSVDGCENLSASMKKKLKQKKRKERKAEVARFDPQKKVKIDTKNKCYVQDEKPRYPLVATPRPLWKREKIIYSDESSAEESESDDESGSTCEDTEEDSEECSSISEEEYENSSTPNTANTTGPSSLASSANSAIIRMSTCSNDSGFEGGTAPSSPKKMLGECIISIPTKWWPHSSILN